MSHPAARDEGWWDEPSLGCALGCHRVLLWELQVANPGWDEPLPLLPVSWAGKWWRWRATCQSSARHTLCAVRTVGTGATFLSTFVAPVLQVLKILAFIFVVPAGRLGQSALIKVTPRWGAGGLLIHQAGPHTIPGALGRWKETSVFVGRLWPC